MPPARLRGSPVQPAVHCQPGCGVHRAVTRVRTVIVMSPIPARAGLAASSRPLSSLSPTLTRIAPWLTHCAPNPRSTSSDLRVVNPPEPDSVMRPQRTNPASSGAGAAALAPGKAGARLTTNPRAPSNSRPLGWARSVSVRTCAQAPEAARQLAVTARILVTFAAPSDVPSSGRGPSVRFLP